MTFEEVRLKLAAALAPVADDDPYVHLELPDALVPPCLLLSWDEPWLDEVNVCNGFAAPVVVAVAGRLVPGAGMTVLETMVQDALRKVRTTGMGVRQVGGPRVFEMAGVTYLAARITLRVPVTF